PAGDQPGSPFPPLDGGIWIVRVATSRAVLRSDEAPQRAVDHLRWLRDPLASGRRSEVHSVAAYADVGRDRRERRGDGGVPAGGAFHVLVRPRTMASPARSVPVVQVRYHGGGGVPGVRYARGGLEDEGWVVAGHSGPN